VVFEIHSVDVIHTFWVPAFRLQEDAVPGITTSFRATPDRLGSYPVICNQLCGYGHSTMRTTLHIITKSAFNTFLAEHGYSGPSAQTASVHSPATTSSTLAAATAAGPNASKERSQ
jgi:cytochrome c oxidase subunit 2